MVVEGSTCAVCKVSLYAHPKCRGCGLLFGGTHLAQDQGDGRCQFYHADSRKRKDRKGKAS